MVAVPDVVPAGEYVPTADQRVLIRIDQEAFERLLVARGEASRPRVAYLDGVLELMSPSIEHERIADHITQMIYVFALERGIELVGLKSATLKDDAGAGVEPDAAFVVGTDLHRRTPDLAVEVVWTHGGLDKLAIYARLGVREVWFWERGAITVHALGADGRYRRADDSACLPGIDLPLVCTLADQPTTAAMRAFRDALRR